MRQHTIAGQRMLDQVGGSMPDVGEIVRASHEHWDGGGYPDGLAGEDVPLPARIVSVADTFSAITTTRPYRARAVARGRDQGAARAAPGTQFDPGGRRRARRACSTARRPATPTEFFARTAHPEPASLRVVRDARQDDRGAARALQRSEPRGERRRPSSRAPARYNIPMKRGDRVGGA